MGEEQVILNERKVNAIRLEPKGSGRRFLHNVSWILGGELLRRRLKSQFAKATNGTEVEAADVKDLTDKWRKNAEITLTNKNLILTWNQGTITKKNKTVALPLQYMSSIEKRGTVGKPICIDFEIPSEEVSDPIKFEIKIFFSKWRWAGRKKEEIWMNELRRIKYSLK